MRSASPSARSAAPTRKRPAAGSSRARSAAGRSCAPRREASPASPTGGAADVVDLSINHPPPVEGAEAAALQAALAGPLAAARRRRRSSPIRPRAAAARTARRRRSGWRAAGHRVAADRIVVLQRQPARPGGAARRCSPARATCILAEELTYPGLQGHRGAPAPARCRRWRWTREGLVPGALDEACRDARARGSCTAMPTIHNPTAAVMRRAAARARSRTSSRRHGLTVIEDDVHGRLADDPPPPIAALAPESTYYVTSTSKTLAPGLRVGFVAAPPGDGRAPGRHRARDHLGRGAPDHGGGGGLDPRRHRGGRSSPRAASEAAARQALARDALAGLGARMSAGAYHVWMRAARRRGAARPSPPRRTSGAWRSRAAEAFLVGTGGGAGRGAPVPGHAPHARGRSSAACAAVRQALESRPETALAIV